MSAQLREPNTAEHRDGMSTISLSRLFQQFVTLFLGPYLTTLAKAAAGSQGMLHPLGIAIDPRSYWSYMVSLSVILQVVFLHGGRDTIMGGVRRRR